MPSSLIHAAVRHLERVPSIDSLADLPELATLMEALAHVPDPRGRRGARYGFIFLLAASVVALRCGARSLIGLARWIRGADRQVLHRLGLRPGAV